MAELKPVDRVEIHILVDNATDSLSSVPKHVETEFSYLHRKGMRVLSGKCICCASHGLSCLITAHHGSANRTLLFDSGPEADTFERNTRQLGIDLGNVEAVVLSHGHWDHAGGLLRAIDMIRSDGKNRDLPYYAHPDMFRPRGRQLPDGGIMPMEDVPSIAELTAHGARVVATREPQAPLDGMFYVSGEIPRVTPFETGLPFHYAKTENGWEPDPWIIDERWLGVHVAGKGLVVFTACSHAGVINVLKDARAKHPDIPLYCVLGGFHLSGATEKIIPETVAALREFGLTYIAAGHCTGWRAMAALVNAFGDQVVTPTAVGKRFVF
ncbi:MAG TPA: MBL fold metallo-hydrolase [Xanthobacteraceae bacterium]|nr:MBL fold metallo-hydrolase [Xanthobacteraceae bacterium]